MLDRPGGHDRGHFALVRAIVRRDELHEHRDDTLSTRCEMIQHLEQPFLLIEGVLAIANSAF